MCLSSGPLKSWNRSPKPAWRRAPAVHTLDNILQRMQAHQAKKRAMLRPLRRVRR
jgi:hypothetical protein